MFAASKGVPGVVAVIPPTTEVGGITFWTDGSYSIVVPSGVYQITAVGIGGGAGGAGSIGQSGGDGGGGGGGGALSYVNNLSVTPGETLTVVVGAGGAGGAGGVSSRTGGFPGGDSYIRRSATNLLLAKGGGGGGLNNGGQGGSSTIGVGDVKYSGGDGGAGEDASIAYGGGGGGAAGYSGVGGSGYDNVTNDPPTAGSGGGGGGSYYNSGGIAYGGGTLFYGEGTSGVAGTGVSASGRLGSSLGGSLSGPINPGRSGSGARGNNGSGGSGESGSAGALRILWGNSPSFPTTNVSTNTVSCVSTGASSSSTINIPSGVTTGDTVVLVDQALSSTSTPTAVTPSGFTSMLTQSGGTYGRYNISYKVITNPADAGTTLTGMNGDTNKKIILVFRGSRGYSRTTSNISTGGFNTTATPSSVTVSDTSVDGYADGIPIVFSMFYGSSGISTGTDTTFSGATYVAGPDNTFWVGYKIYGQSTTSFSDTISMTDRGTNSLVCVQMFGY